MANDGLQSDSPRIDRQWTDATGKLTDSSYVLLWKLWKRTGRSPGVSSEELEDLIQSLLSTAIQQPQAFDTLPDVVQGREAYPFLPDTLQPNAPPYFDEMILQRPDFTAQISALSTDLLTRIPVLPSIVALKARSKLLVPASALVTDYYSTQKGGGGLYVLDPLDTTSADNGGTIIVATDGGRWFLRYAGAVSVDQFGAKGDGTTNDGAALAAAFATGLDVTATQGRIYRFTAPLTLVTAGQVIDLGGAKLKPAGTFSAITLSASLITLRNLIMDCSALSGIGISAPTAVQRIVMEDVTLQGGTSGLSMIDCYTSWFVRCNFNLFSVAPAVIKSTISGTPTNSMWFDACSFNDNTTPGDVLRIEGGSGIWVRGCNFQANGTTCNEVRITTNAASGTEHVTVEDSYFENLGVTGNSIYVGDPAAGSNPCTGIVIRNNKTQVSKRPITIGTLVSDDITITENSFQFTTLGGFAVVAPAGFVPNCHGNTGSMGDFDRTWQPLVAFGGASVGVVYGLRTGRIHRNGVQVWGEFALQLTAKGSSTGAAVITGLPKVSSSTALLSQVTSAFQSGMAGLTGDVAGYITASSAAINLVTGGATGAAGLSDANFTNTSVLYGSFRYEV